MKVLCPLLTIITAIALTGCGGESPEPEPVSTVEIPVEDLPGIVLDQIPAGAFDSVAVLQLVDSTSDVPLWLVHSSGMVNWDMDPQFGHFVVVYTWSGSQWSELDRMRLGDETGSPDYLSPDGVSQVDITDDFIWVSVEGGAGAHGGTYQLLTFDGDRLASRFASTFCTPGFAQLENLPADSLIDLVLNYSDPYVFFYASALRKPDIRVVRWDPMDLEMVEMELQRLPQTAPEELSQHVDRAVDLAGAGLWMQAGEVMELVYPASGELSERDRWIVDWDYVLISQNAGMAEALVDCGYPLLARVFYGDYDSALDLIRQFEPAEVFSGSSPLIVGTAAEGWESELSAQLVQSSGAAVEVEPGLASAWFIRGWGTWLADPADPAVVEYVTEASDLAPDDQYLTASLQYLSGQ
jgi:hypothetical protein